MRKWIWNKEICCQVCLSPTRGRHMPSFGAASGWRWHPLRCLSPLHSGPAPLLPSTLCTGQYPSLRFLLGYFPHYHRFHAAISPPRITSIGGYDRSCARNQRSLLPANDALSVCAAKPKKTRSREKCFFFLIGNNVSGWSNANRPKMKAPNAKRTNPFQLEMHNVRDTRAFARRRAARILHHAAPQIRAKLRDCNVKGGGRAFSQLWEMLARCLPFMFTTSTGWTQGHTSLRWCTCTGRKWLADFCFVFSGHSSTALSAR